MEKMKMEGLSYRYGDKEVLKDLNLTIEEGQIVCILGPSGVGKTTLFHLIAGILPVQSGEIVINGQQNPRGQVSYMLQKDLLLEHKRAVENVMLPLEIAGVPRSEAKERALAALKRFGLEGVAESFPQALSGGMRQRVALLRTYMMGHDVFLLDEAFSALDEMTKLSLYQWYRGIHKDLDLTTLLITHSIEEALELSDKIYILNGQPGHFSQVIEVQWKEQEDRDVQAARLKRQVLEGLGLG